MRGKPIAETLGRDAKGITPAHAGKTSSRTPRTSRPRDHPRACGENLDIPFWKVSTLGSPPRMRGKPKWSQKKKVAAGITPAHAGKTTTDPAHTTARRDHPRACGENPCTCARFARYMGSPPRMRGKHFGQAAV